MKHFFTFILLIVSQLTLACNYSNIDLISVSPLGGDQYQIIVEVCAGSGQFGGNNHTGNFQVVLSGFSTMISASPSVISPQTGAEYSSSIGVNDVTYTNPFQWFATTCLGGPTCPPATPVCVFVTLITQGYPDAIHVNGLESADDFVSGCVEFITLPHMPIELIHFSAIGGDCEAEITWEVETEINNDFFVVEKSKDNIEYETVCIVKGRGTTDQPETYSCMDYDKGLQYYRLRQVDYDGTYTNSRVIAEHLGDCKKLEYSPNPVKDELNIQMYSQIDTSYDIKIHAVSGELIHELTWNIGQGVNTILVDFKSIASGMYIVSIESSVVLDVFKIVK